jgi:hypothetical protein
VSGEPGYLPAVGAVLFWSGVVVCLCWIAAELGDAARSFLDQARDGNPEEAGDGEAAPEGRAGAPPGDRH